MTDEILENVQAELAAAMVPFPDDYAEELTPHAALFIGRQLSMCVQKVVTGAAISLDEDPDGEAGAIAEVLNGVAAAVAGFTHACVALGILPPEAEEALADGIAG